MREQLWTPDARQLAGSLGFEVEFNPYESDPGEAVWADMLQGIDALITTWGAPRLTDAVLKGAGALKIVGHAAGSVAGIVSPALFERGIRLVTANTVMAEGVAVWGLMMTLVGWRKLLEYAKLGGHGAVDWGKRDCPRDIRSATVAIWGYGDIARRLIGMLRGVGVTRIIVHDDYLTATVAAEAGIEKVGFDDLFRRGDIIHLLMSLTPVSSGRVGPPQLAAIRNDAVLINAGRADLVQEKALLDELRRNRFTAILDVHHQEPLLPDNPFLALANVILTPHVAGGGPSSSHLYVLHVMREFERFFAGQPLQGEISAERAATMTQESLVKHGQQKREP